jgi:hypothetical protein
MSGLMIIFAIMLQKIKHIASGFLILIFLFPMMYQFQHVVLLPGMHHLHNTSQCCGHDHCHSTGLPENVDTDGTVQRFETNEEQCQICEFHYAVIHTTYNQYYVFDNDHYSSQHKLLSTHPFLNFQGHSRSLRAPPCLPFFC